MFGFGGRTKPWAARVEPFQVVVATGEASEPEADSGSFCKLVVVYLRALDFRFKDREEEHRFKDSLELDLLRWMLLGCTLAAVCTTFNSFSTFGPELLTGPETHDFSDMSDLRNIVFFGQLLLWTIVPACLGCLLALRIFQDKFKAWNWEVIVTCTMCYGIVVIVVGQLFHLTKIIGGDIEMWKSDDVTCSAEAWVLLGLNTMTNAACFFLPVRSIVSWLVPVFGLMTYSVMKASFATTDAIGVVVKILLLIALSYLAWHGSANNEKHLRTEWRVLQEVRKASEKIVEQQVSIQQGAREIQEKEREIEATTDLVKSLQTVTRALCDTMVHLTSDLVIRNSDTAGTFFEKDVEGMLFTDLLTKEDQARFIMSLSRASQSNIPVCLPVTVHKQFTTSECHLVLVHRGNTELQYLVGIRTEKDNPIETQSLAVESRGKGAGITSAFGFGAMPGAVPEPPAIFNSIIPRAIGSIDEDLESDFSFTTYPKADPPRPPKFTNSRARARTIRMILKRWNIPRDCESCCQYHTVLDSIDEAVECLRQQKCDPLWSTYNEQCPRCACMNQGPKCVVCGFAPEANPKGGRNSGRNSGKPVETGLGE
mmetsp:Transcript_40062/g.128527  ORF Transcript_40062/g.128527 Transcript_40062/m.128527 type:complete len:596 (+) Transcript_40062:135-1922(+)